jgi:hypothetical protein
VHAERFAAGGEAIYQRGDRGDREPQTVARTRRIRLARGGDEAGDMRLLLNRLAGIVAADMASDLVAPAIRRTVVALASSVSGRRTWVCGIE